MDFLERMTRVIDYIEAHLDENFSLQDLAGIVCCDVYQFGRIFAYVVGMPLAEYVRGRRLSLAALELSRGGLRVIDAALKYGSVSYTHLDVYKRQVRGDALPFCRGHGLYRDDLHRDGQDRV